jgi:2-polyprenyl-3-methyl-5-hydroxy-6-metoxy-1,4-benzoquinol methylase
VYGRHLIPEVMDRPDLDRHEHQHALAGLERINRWSASAGMLWRPIRQLLRQSSDSSLSVLDVGCGGGDVALALWRKAGAQGSTLEIQGWDLSPVAVEFAQRRAALAGAKIDFCQRDALGPDWDASYDVIMSSLFLHHLEDDQAIVLLGRMRQCARRLVLINDLRRSRFGWVLAILGTRMLSRSPVVRFDGPISVRRAFTCPEVLTLAERASMTGATIERRWPCRFLFNWSPADARSVP